MEAIRKAGGKAKLRAAEPQPTSAGGGGSSSKQQTSEKAVSGGGGGGGAGNLMDDLHKKLMMRRKGISGTKKPANVMDRLSALIPPPELAEAKPSASGEDEEEDWK